MYCYLQDLVIPNLKHPAELAVYSPLFGRPERKRSILLLFRGDVGMKRDRHYSRGIRQKLYALVYAPRAPSSFSASETQMEHLLHRILLSLFK